jgi:tetratricopeptide (TPR) repeat protein
MAREFLDENEGKAWLKQYELMLRNEHPGYLDLEAYEFIIYHYVNQNEPAKARAACEKAMETFPYSSELLLDYAHVLANCGENQSAMEMLRKAEPFFPYDIDLIVLKCTLLNFEGRHKEVLHYLTGLETVVEQKERLYHALASTFFQMESPEEAITWFRKSLDLVPSSECLEEFVLCLSGEDRLEESLEYYKRALDANPFDALLWLSNANVLNTLEMFDEAKNAIEYCLALEENMHIAHFQRGNILMNLELYEEASEAYLAAIAIHDKQSEYYVGVGAAMESLEKYDMAIHYFRRSIKINPEQDDAYFGIGTCLLEMEKFAESIHFFNKAIHFDPENPNYWISKGIAEYGMGNVVSAEIAFEKGYELDPENIALWLDWSHIYFEQGHADKAIQMMEEAIALMPDEALLYYRAAAYHFSEGRLKEAVLFLENGIILDYDSHAVLYEFFEDIKTQKTLYRIIQEIRSKGKGTQ